MTGYFKKNKIHFPGGARNINRGALGRLYDIKQYLPFLLVISVFSCGNDRDLLDRRQDGFIRAARNGSPANEALERCNRYVHGWLRHADPQTGLIPRNLSGGKDIWNAGDAAADNYPFMVLTCALTDRDLFEGRMLDMLKSEIRRTSRLGALPDTWSFKTQDFTRAVVDTAAIIFGASEYIKDGLLPLTEWLGPSPWAGRMTAILDDIWTYAPVRTPYGKIPSKNREVNGEMLQVLSRVYHMTGEEKYLEYAIRLGDYYLHDHNPARSHHLRLRDHGCEILSGLTELYAAVHFARVEKKKTYQAPLYELLDRVLEVGRNPHGLFYNTINPLTGEHDPGLCDTWGYNLNGYYTVYLLDGVAAYRDAVVLALSNLHHYPDYDWENGSADGDADAVEGALNLYNRERVETAAQWIDAQIQIMWSKQQKNGVIEGWHGDGNFARTSLMYALWKSAGVTLRPWRKDMVLGAHVDESGVFLSLKSGNAWHGKIFFDTARHREYFDFSLDYPRINQFPEWFTVEPGKRYHIISDGEWTRMSPTGEQLLNGMPVAIPPQTEIRFLVRELL